MRIDKILEELSDGLEGASIDKNSSITVEYDEFIRHRWPGLIAAESASVALRD